MHIVLLPQIRVQCASHRLEPHERMKCMHIKIEINQIDADQFVHV